MIYDIIIIGGGPAGLTAGIYSARQRMNTLIITKEYGGQMGKKATDICNYPSYKRIAGQELIAKFVEHLQDQKFVETKFSEVRKIEKKGNEFTVITTEKEKFKSKAVLIATGADPKSLGVIGEKEFIGRGVSYCVTCDGPIFRNKEVAIIGGGNAGFEAGLFMSNYAKKVSILEFGDKFGADLINQEELKKIGKVDVITNAQVKEIKGDKMVNSLVYTDVKTKKDKILDVQGIFIEIGRQPATSIAKGLVDFTEKDEIKVDVETFQTKTPGLFAAGDVNQGKYRQIVTAAGEGCKAVLAAYEYLKNIK